MAYASSGAGNRRRTALAAVAGLHAIVLYALMTGLGGVYVAPYVPALTGRNIPLDPPPPTPDPTLEPTQRASDPNAANVTVTPEVRPLPSGGPSFAIDLGDAPSAGPLPGNDFVIIPSAGVELPKSGSLARTARPSNRSSGWVTTDDYPASALRRGEQGSVRFEVSVGASGKVEDCRITGPSGSPALDAATCRHVTARARFEPARDDGGAAVAGTWSSSVTWVIPER